MVYTASLDEYLKRLIAERDGVKPEDVTPSYIREQREKRIYPKVRYCNCSEYGGYNLNGLEVYTREELEKKDKQATEWLEQF